MAVPIRYDESGNVIEYDGKRIERGGSGRSKTFIVMGRPPRVPPKNWTKPDKSHASWCPKHIGAPGFCGCHKSPLGAIVKRIRRREVSMGTRTDKIEVYQRSDGTFDWRRKSGYNGRVVSTSGGQGYVRAGTCRNAAIKKNPDVPEDRIIIVKE